jgi:hypothetical protein
MPCHALIEARVENLSLASSLLMMDNSSMPITSLLSLLSLPPPLPEHPSHCLLVHPSKLPSSHSGIKLPSSSACVAGNMVVAVTVAWSFEDTQRLSGRGAINSIEVLQIPLAARLPMAAKGILQVSRFTCKSSVLHMKPRAYPGKGHATEGWPGDTIFWDFLVIYLFS